MTINSPITLRKSSLYCRRYGTVVDVPTDTALIKCDDLYVERRSGWLAEKTGHHKYLFTYSIWVFPLRVGFDQFEDVFSWPPISGIILNFSNSQHHLEYLHVCPTSETSGDCSQTHAVSITSHPTRPKARHAPCNSCLRTSPIP